MPFQSVTIFTARKTSPVTPVDKGVRTGTTYKQRPTLLAKRMLWTVCTTHFQEFMARAVSTRKLAIEIMGKYIHFMVRPPEKMAFFSDRDVPVPSSICKGDCEQPVVGNTWLPLETEDAEWCHDYREYSNPVTSF